MVVGASQESSFHGRVYLIPISPDVPSLPETVLSSPYLSATGSFGYSVAISSGIVAVGAPQDTVGFDTAAGNVYLFSTNGTLLHNLSAPSPSPSAAFGESVSMSGSLVVVGAPEPGTSNPGAAYVYSATTGNLVQTLASGNPKVGGEFGWSVALDGGTALVGAPGELISGNLGNAYLLGASTGSVLATLTNPNPQTGAQFGYAVSVAGGVAVVGAPDENVGSLTGAGRAYTFSETSGALISTLQSPNATSDGIFGGAVSTNGGTVVVGASQESAVVFANAGNAYVFNASDGAIMDRFYSPNAQLDGNFGDAVFDGPTRILVGANFETASGSFYAGNAYVLGFEDAPLDSLAYPPSAPTGLTASGVTTTTVNLEWTNPSGTLTDNRIYGYGGGACSGPTFWVWDLGAPGFHVDWSSLTPSTTFSWEVTAVSAGGEGPPSNCASATTL